MYDTVVQGAKTADRRRSSTRSKISSGYLFIAPALILITLLAIYPTFRVIYLSITQTTRMTGATSFVGLSNYQAVLADPVFRQAFRQTLVFSGVSSLGHVALGFILAMIMNLALNRKFMGACRSIVLLPWALSPIVVAIVAKLWAHPLISPVAKILQALGSQADWTPLADPSTALWTLITLNIWQFTPFFMLMILAGLQTLDPELLAAAMVDGASGLQRIRYVILPHVREVLLTMTLFDLVTTAAYFDLIWVTTQGGPVRSTEVLATLTYRLGFWNMNWNMAAAVGMILLLLCIMISAFVVFVMQRD